MTSNQNNLDLLVEAATQLPTILPRRSSRTRNQTVTFTPPPEPLRGNTGSRRGGSTQSPSTANRTEAANLRITATQQLAPFPNGSTLRECSNDNFASLICFLGDGQLALPSNFPWSLLDNDVKKHWEKFERSGSATLSATAAKSAGRGNNVTTVFYRNKADFCHYARYIRRFLRKRRTSATFNQALRSSVEYFFFELSNDDEPYVFNGESYVFQRDEKKFLEALRIQRLQQLWPKEPKMTPAKKALKVAQEVWKARAHLRDIPTFDSTPGTNPTYGTLDHSDVVNVPV